MMQTPFDADHPLFSPTYAVARERFVDRARRAGAEVERHIHPEVRGPAAEALSIDVAFLGPRAAEGVLVVVSGTHGVEGFAGSAVQLALLDHLAEHTPPVGLMLVHALNPYGFAWIRRSNEDNIDLNRNFIDHAHPPDDADYRALHPLLLPEAWHGAVRDAADAGLMAKVAELGPKAVQSAITTGQYSHPDGLYYGGRGPAWSNGVLRGLIAARLSGVPRLGVVDIHTGLGPSGHGALLFSGEPGGAECARAQAWWGADEVEIERLGEAISPPLDGEMPTAFDGVKGEVTRITLEYGTAPMLEVLQALRAETWLTARGAVQTAEGRAAKRALRAAFERPDPRWRADVLARGRAVIDKAMVGLARG